MYVCITEYNLHAKISLCFCVFLKQNGCHHGRFVLNLDLIDIYGYFKYRGEQWKDFS